MPGAPHADLAGGEPVLHVRRALEEIRHPDGDLHGDAVQPQVDGLPGGGGREDPGSSASNQSSACAGSAASAETAAGGNKAEAGNLRPGVRTWAAVTA